MPFCKFHRPFLLSGKSILLLCVFIKEKVSDLNGRHKECHVLFSKVAVCSCVKNMSILFYLSVLHGKKRHEEIIERHLFNHRNVKNGTMHFIHMLVKSFSLFIFKYFFKFYDKFY